MEGGEAGGDEGRWSPPSSFSRGHGKDTGFEVQQTWACIPALPLLSCATFGNFLHFLIPRLENGDHSTSPAVRTQRSWSGSDTVSTVMCCTDISLFPEATLHGSKDRIIQQEKGLWRETKLGLSPGIFQMSTTASPRDYFAEGGSQSFSRSFLKILCKWWFLLTTGDSLRGCGWGQTQVVRSGLENRKSVLRPWGVWGKGLTQLQFFRLNGNLFKEGDACPC